VLTEDYPIHQLMMRNYRVTAESGAQQAWLAANDDFRRYVLDLIRDSGPLVVKVMYAEPGAAPDPALPSAFESLASFAGVGLVSYAGPTAFGVS